MVKNTSLLASPDSNPTALIYIRSPVATTEARYNSHIRKFNDWNDGAAVTADRIAEYFAAMRGELSASTLRGRKSALKKSIRNTFGAAGQDPAWRAQLDIAFRDIRTPSPRPFVDAESLLSGSDIEMLAGAMPRKLALMLRALFSSGFRITELLTIRVRDCKEPPPGDRRRRRRRVVVRVIGKGLKERRIPAFRAELYAAIVEEFAPANRNAYLFCNRNPRSKSGMYSRQYVWREFNRFALEYLGRPLHPHLLRHSHASRLLESGVVIDAVADRLGHSDRGTTANYYAHTGISGDQLDAADI